VPPFRRSGSFVRFFVEGTAPAPQRSQSDSDEFVLALAENRFTSIERSASEAVSVGWVSPSDPSGGDFTRDEIAMGDLLRLRMRVDRKKLPRAWMAIYMTAEVRARNGHGVTAAERADIRADIERRLMPRLLPTVQFIDVIWNLKNNTVLFFATSDFLCAECAKLFAKTWSVKLIEVNPTSLAQRSRLPEDMLNRLGDIAPFGLDPGQTTRAQTGDRYDVSRDDDDVIEEGIEEANA
jgi:DNA recombination-dependent growth factor C